MGVDRIGGGNPFREGIVLRLWNRLKLKCPFSIFTCSPYSVSRNSPNLSHPRFAGRAVADLTRLEKSANLTLQFKYKTL